jgi:hypothetical protein
LLGVVEVVVARNDDGLNEGKLLFGLPNEFEARDERHLNIGDDQIRLQRNATDHGIVAVLIGSDYLESICFLVQKTEQSFPDCRLVVDNDDAIHNGFILSQNERDKKRASSLGPLKAKKLRITASRYRKQSVAQ